MWMCEFMTEVFTELFSQTGVDRVKSSHGLEQIFPPVFDLHRALSLQDATSGQQKHNIQKTQRQLWWYNFFVQIHSTTFDKPTKTL